MYPVDTEIHPDYLSWIREPRCLVQICDGLIDNTYRCSLFVKQKIKCKGRGEERNRKTDREKLKDRPRETDRERRRGEREREGEREKYGDGERLVIIQSRFRNRINGRRKQR